MQFQCGRHLWKPPKFGNPFLPSTANSRCFSEWRIIMTRLAAVHKAATKSLLTGEGKHWDWGQDWASLSGTLGTSLLSPLKCTLNNSMKKGTLCFAPSVMMFRKAFLHVPLAVRLILQLRCSPIGNKNFQNKTKHHDWGDETQCIWGWVWWNGSSNTVKLWHS